jgi:hypothetical protein
MFHVAFEKTVCVMCHTVTVEMCHIHAVLCNAALHRMAYWRMVSLLKALLPTFLQGLCAAEAVVLAHIPVVFMLAQHPRPVGVRE